MKSELHWPVGIAAILVLFVAFLIGFVVFTTSMPINLVSTDYYKRSVDYQTRIDRTAQAADYPIEHRYEAGEQLLIISGLSNGKAILEGKVTLYRPANAKEDRVFSFPAAYSGDLKIEAGNLASGIWEVRMEWRCADGEYYREFRFRKP